MIHYKLCNIRENKKGNQPFLFLMSSNSLMIPNIINPPPDNTSTTLNIFFIYYHLLFIIWRVIYANNKKRISNAKRRGPVVVTEPFFFWINSYCFFVLSLCSVDFLFFSFDFGFSVRSQGNLPECFSFLSFIHKTSVNLIFEFPHKKARNICEKEKRV